MENEEALALWLQNNLEQLHTAIPGRIQIYDQSTQLATVKPSVRPRSLHGDVFEIPPVKDVPVLWPSCGQFTLSGTLREGDGVLLLVAECGIGNWLQSTQDTDAEDQTRFSLQDAVCIPGLWQPSRVPSHKRIKAQWGLMSGNAEIGATDSGRISIANQVSDLRAELETLYSHVAAINTYLQVNAALLQAAATGPLAPLQPGFAGMNAGATAQGVSVPLSKAALKGLLT